MQGKSGYYVVQGAMVVILMMIGVTASGCEVIGGIFKAGLWVGIIAVVVVLGGIMLLMRLFKG